MPRYEQIQIITSTYQTNGKTKYIPTFERQTYNKLNTKQDTKIKN